MKLKDALEVFYPDEQTLSDEFSLAKYNEFITNLDDDILNNVFGFNGYSQSVNTVILFKGKDFTNKEILKFSCRLLKDKFDNNFVLSSEFDSKVVSDLFELVKIIYENNFNKSVNVVNNNGLIVGKSNYNMSIRTAKESADVKLVDYISCLYNRSKEDEDELINFLRLVGVWTCFREFRFNDMIQEDANNELIFNVLDTAMYSVRLDDFDLYTFDYTPNRINLLEAIPDGKELKYQDYFNRNPVPITLLDSRDDFYDYVDKAVFENEYMNYSNLFSNIIRVFYDMMLQDKIDNKKFQEIFELFDRDIYDELSKNNVTYTRMVEVVNNKVDFNTYDRIYDSVVFIFNCLAISTIFSEMLSYNGRVMSNFNELIIYVRDIFLLDLVDIDNSSSITHVNDLFNYKDDLTDKTPRRIEFLNILEQSGLSDELLGNDKETAVLINILKHNGFKGEDIFMYFKDVFLEAIEIGNKLKGKEIVEVITTELKFVTSIYDLNNNSDKEHTHSKLLDDMIMTDLQSYIEIKTVHKLRLLTADLNSTSSLTVALKLLAVYIMLKYGLHEVVLGEGKKDITLRVLDRLFTGVDVIAAECKDNGYTEEVVMNNYFDVIGRLPNSDVSRIFDYILFKYRKNNKLNIKKDIKNILKGTTISDLDIARTYLYLNDLACSYVITEVQVRFFTGLLYVLEYVFDLVFKRKTNIFNKKDNVSYIDKLKIGDAFEGCGKLVGKESFMSMFNFIAPSDTFDALCNSLKTEKLNTVKDKFDSITEYFTMLVMDDILKNCLDMEYVFYSNSYNASFSRLSRLGINIFDSVFTEDKDTLDYLYARDFIIPYKGLGINMVCDGLQFTFDLYERVYNDTVYVICLNLIAGKTVGFVIIDITSGTTYNTGIGFLAMSNAIYSVYNSKFESSFGDVELEVFSPYYWRNRGKQDCTNSIHRTKMSEEDFIAKCTHIAPFKRKINPNSVRGAKANELAKRYCIKLEDNETLVEEHDRNIKVKKMTLFNK